jgi:hypothetical protein
MTTKEDFYTYNLEDFSNRNLSENRRKDLQKLFNHELIQLALLNNGYIAGGVLRHAIGRQEPLCFLEENMSAISSYLSKGGDIDIFFKNKIDYENFIRLITVENQKISESFKIQTKPEKNAKNLTITLPIYEKSKFSIKELLVETKVQIVFAIFDEPVGMMCQFDIINSMIATDGKLLWINKNCCDLEESKTISINRNQNSRNQTLAFRISKYLMRYGYNSFDLNNQSIYSFASWCQEKLSPEHISKCSGREQNKYALQLNCLNKIIQDQNLIPTTDLLLFIGLSELPHLVKTSPFCGLYHEEEDYIYDGNIDSAVAQINFRTIVESKNGRKPPNKNNDMFDYNMDGLFEYDWQ